MKQQTIITGSIIAVGIIAVVICIGMVSGNLIFKQFITIDPIGDKNTGDSIIITGTTNLPTGSLILVEVYAESYGSNSGTIKDPKTGEVSGEFSGATGTVTVAKGQGNVNTWSLPLDTKTFMPREYVVTASTVNGDISKGDYKKGDIYGATKFALLQPLTPIYVAEKFINIDPVGNKKTGNKFTLTGSTNLASGTEVLVRVYEASFESGYGTITDPKTGAISGEFSGAVGIVKVTSGSSGNNNRWSMDLDTTPLNPGEYHVNASLFKGDIKQSDFTTGNPIGSTKFTVN